MALFVEFFFIIFGEKMSSFGPPVFSFWRRLYVGQSKRAGLFPLGGDIRDVFLSIDFSCFY